MEPKTNPNIEDPRVIDPGDVLFFAPPVEAGNFDDFAQLAAYAQGAPWHHVAIAGNRHNDVPQVVGFLFESTETQAGVNWLLDPIDAHDWATATSGSAITALRPPEGRSAAVRDAAAAQMGSVYYDLDGLLAFAAATCARMFVGGSARTTAMQFAVGVEAARDNGEPMGHTCVSAVATALTDAGVALELSELPPRPVPTNDQLRDIAAVIEKFLGKARAATSFGALDEAVGPLSWDQIRDGWGVEFGIEDPGGLVQNTSDYLAIITKVASGFRDDGYTAEELIALGQGNLGDVAPSRSWRTSPAMLHAALLKAGFTPIA